MRPLTRRPFLTRTSIAVGAAGPTAAAALSRRQFFFATSLAIAAAGGASAAGTPLGEAASGACYGSPFDCHWALARRLIDDGAVGSVLRIQSRLTRDALVIQRATLCLREPCPLGPAGDLIYHQLAPLFREDLLTEGKDGRSPVTGISVAGGAFATGQSEADALLVTLQIGQGRRVVAIADPLPHPSYVFIRGDEGEIEFSGDLVNVRRAGVTVSHSVGKQTAARGLRAAPDRGGNESSLATSRLLMGIHEKYRRVLAPLDA